MKVIVGTKVYNRDENITYPNCKVCGFELSPFAFNHKELSIDKIIQFERANLILEKLYADIIVLMCKQCCKHIGLRV